MGEKSKNTLLITGAIDITPYNIPVVQIIDLQERLSQYLYSIEYAINHYSKVDNIVFCENTDHKFDYSSLQDKAKSKGKHLEVLTFKGNYDNIQRKGKGYGEGETIKYALNHSEILAQSDNFYKLTGRIVVTNMDKIINKTTHANAFIFPIVFKCVAKQIVETIFYKTSKVLYTQRLLDAYLEIDDNRNIILEHVFFDILNEISLKSFSEYPNIVGYSASTGQPYTKSKKVMLKNKLFARLGFFGNRRSILHKIVICVIQTFKGDYNMLRLVKK